MLRSETKFYMIVIVPLLLHRYEKWIMKIRGGTKYAIRMKHGSLKGVCKTENAESLKHELQIFL